MKRMALRLTLAASALIVFAACTVNESDDEGDGGAGSGGSTAGSGGSTAGTGGSTAGTGGSTAGTGGGTAGTAGTAGAAGAGGIACADIFQPGDCATCITTNCCTEAESCYNDAVECGPSMACFDTCTDDYDTCKSTCDDGNFNVAYNEFLTCMENNCVEACQ